jgi:Transcription factor Tfb2
MPIQVSVFSMGSPYFLRTYSANLDNPLQTAVLNLFVSLKYRFPNLVVGSITRESVKKALDNGISAEQVRMVIALHCRIVYSDRLYADH